MPLSTADNPRWIDEVVIFAGRKRKRSTWILYAAGALVLVLIIYYAIKMKKP